MTDYRRLGLAVLTTALNEFEGNNTFNLSDGILDKIWDVSIKINDNKRISRFFGRYFMRACRIEMCPHMFEGNLIAYKDTVLHELAHHITDTLFPGCDSHGDEWKRICVLVGAEPKHSKNLSAWSLQWNQVKNNGFYQSFKKVSNEL